MKKFKIKDSNGKAYIIEAKTYKEALKRFKDAIKVKDSKKSFVLKRKKNDKGEYVIEAYRDGKRNTPYDYTTSDYDDAVKTLNSLARDFKLTVSRNADMFIADSKVGDSVSESEIKPGAIFKDDLVYYKVISIYNGYVKFKEYGPKDFKGPEIVSYGEDIIPYDKFLKRVSSSWAKKVTKVGDESPVKGLEPGMIFKVEEGYSNIYYKIIKITDKDVYFQRYSNREGSTKYQGSMDSEPISYFLRTLKRAKRVNTIYDYASATKEDIKPGAIFRSKDRVNGRDAFYYYKVLTVNNGRVTVDTYIYDETNMYNKVTYTGKDEGTIDDFLLLIKDKTTVKVRKVGDSISREEIKIGALFKDPITNLYYKILDVRNKPYGQQVDFQIYSESNGFKALPEDFRSDTLENIYKLMGNRWKRVSRLGDSVDTANIDFDYLLAEERKAVEDYKNAIASTDDKSALYVLSHILKEESHHIELLEQLRDGKVEFADSTTADETITVSKRKRNTASDNDAVDAAVDVLSEYGLHPDEGVDREDSYRGSLDFSSKSNRDRAVSILKKSNQFRIVDPYGDEEGLFSIHIKM